MLFSWIFYFWVTFFELILLILYVRDNEQVTHSFHYGFRYFGVKTMKTDDGNTRFGFNVGFRLNPFPYGYSYSFDLEKARQKVRGP